MSLGFVSALGNGTFQPVSTCMFPECRLSKPTTPVDEPCNPGLGLVTPPKTCSMLVRRL